MVNYDQTLLSSKTDIQMSGDDPSPAVCDPFQTAKCARAVTSDERHKPSSIWATTAGLAFRLDPQQQLRQMAGEATLPDLLVDAAWLCWR